MFVKTSAHPNGVPTLMETHHRRSGSVGYVWSRFDSKPLWFKHVEPQASGISAWEVLPGHNINPPAASIYSDWWVNFNGFQPTETGGFDRKITRWRHPQGPWPMARLFLLQIPPLEIPLASHQEETIPFLTEKCETVLLHSNMEIKRIKKHRNMGIWRIP